MLDRRRQCLCFKPYYNWNTFNTQLINGLSDANIDVLNLIITGIPSIPRNNTVEVESPWCFKPYYNWNTFNTMKSINVCTGIASVLNLIITGIPSILTLSPPLNIFLEVLNLIITGIPSIPKKIEKEVDEVFEF